MYLKACKRRKNGKEHRYFSVVESRRLPGGRVFQRQVLYLGEINDSQQAAWRKTLSVAGDRGQDPQTMSLFPDDRPVPPGAINAVQVRMSEMVLRRSRAYGDCWLGCELWRQLQLDGFWHKRLPDGKEQVPWAKVLQLLVVSRLHRRASASPFAKTHSEPLGGETVPTSCAAHYARMIRPCCGSATCC